MNQKIYNTLIEKFFASEKIGDYSLAAISRASASEGHPERHYKVIHIAGTNGKGSVARMIFSVLKGCGKKVGVYTSPHLMDIRERFETEKGRISQEDFYRLSTHIINTYPHLSYFEKCTLLAFLYFKEQGCEFVVLETGLGGRLDASNIVIPILSIITSISYDHIEFLGDTLEKISREKAGIIKYRTPVLLYGKNLTIEKIAKSQESKIFFPSKRHITTHLLGEHQQKNSQIAYTACRFLGIDTYTILSGLTNVSHKGRLQYIHHNLLIDGAHNEAGIHMLQKYITSIKQSWKEIKYCIFLKKGKYPQLIDTIIQADRYICITYKNDMLEDAEILKNRLENIGKIGILQTPDEIMKISQNDPETLYIVFGSLYGIGVFLGM